MNIDDSWIGVSRSIPYDAVRDILEFRIQLGKLKQVNGYVDWPECIRIGIDVRRENFIVMKTLRQLGTGLVFYLFTSHIVTYTKVASLITQPDWPPHHRGDFPVKRHDNPEQSCPHLLV